jgi:hypothetical protein
MLNFLTLSNVFYAYSFSHFPRDCFDFSVGWLDIVHTKWNFRPFILLKGPSRQENLYTIDNLFTAPELEGPPRQENQHQEVSSVEESPSETQPLFKEVSIDPTIVTHTPSSPCVNGHEESNASDTEQPVIEEIIIHSKMLDSDEVTYNCLLHKTR